MQKKQFFYIFLILMIATALVFLLIHFVYGNLDAVLFVNKSNHPIADFLFKYLTKLGEAWGIVICVLFFVILKKWNWVLFAGGINLLIGGISAFFKYQIFSGSPRPRGLLNNDKLIHFIEGIDVHFWDSYPSGHTLTAVACCTIFALYFSHYAQLQIACWLVATLVALSRIYLFQHFFMDVATSYFIAMFVTFGLYKVFLPKLTAQNFKNERV